VLVRRGAEVGPALVSHPLVNKVSFTGSTVVGKQVGIAALHNMTRFTLELGGKNPMLRLEDADINKAVAGAIGGGSRIYVPAQHYARFVDALSAQVAGMSIGTGMDPHAQVNPLVSKKQQNSVLNYLDIARREGARFATGGGALIAPATSSPRRCWPTWSSA
jgi:phenylacetaldehyde dehydrogenase